MRTTIQNEAFTLLQRGEQPSPVLIAETHLLGLPEVVQRYLRYTQIIGKEPIRTVHLKQKGSFRTKEGQKWLPLIAEQYYTVQPPAFLWHGVIKQNPLLSISAVDRFSDGHGSLLVKLLSFITLVDAHGPEADQGELLRYLSEIVWFPTAWLSDSIEWQALDARSARATIHHCGVTASAVLSFNEKDQLTRMIAQRYRLVNGRSVLEQWETRGGEYREVNGMRIPVKAEAVWKLRSGDFSYFRGEITEIAYNEDIVPIIV
jgi:hypothetical protein